LLSIFLGQPGLDFAGHTYSIETLISRDGGLRALWVMRPSAQSPLFKMLSAALVGLLNRSIQLWKHSVLGLLCVGCKSLSIIYHQPVPVRCKPKSTRDVESVEMMSRQMVDVGFFRARDHHRRGVEPLAWAYVFILFVPMIVAFASFHGGKMRRYNETSARKSRG